MAFTLHPVGPEDTADITRIYQAAFANDHIMGHFYTHTPESIKWDQDYEFYKTQIAECGVYGGRMTKVVEESTGLVSSHFSHISYLAGLRPTRHIEHFSLTCDEKEQTRVQRL